MWWVWILVGFNVWLTIAVLLGLWITWERARFPDSDLPSPEEAFWICALWPGTVPSFLLVSLAETVARLVQTIGEDGASHSPDKERRARKFDKS